MQDCLSFRAYIGCIRHSPQDSRHRKCYLKDQYLLGRLWPCAVRAVDLPWSRYRRRLDMRRLPKSYPASFSTWGSAHSHTFLLPSLIAMGAAPRRRPSLIRPYPHTSSFFYAILPPAVFPSNFCSSFLITCSTLCSPATEPSTGQCVACFGSRGSQLRHTRHRTRRLPIAKIIQAHSV